MAPRFSRSLTVKNNTIYALNTQYMSACYSFRFIVCGTLVSSQCKTGQKIISTSFIYEDTLPACPCAFVRKTIVKNECYYNCVLKSIDI